MTKAKSKSSAKSKGSAGAGGGDGAKETPAATSQKTEQPSEPEAVGSTQGRAPEVDENGNVVDKAGTYYCPGCGRRYDNPATCTGSGEAPHAPIDTAPVSELKKDESKHTAAPDTGA